MKMGTSSWTHAASKSHIIYNKVVGKVPVANSPVFALVLQICLEPNVMLSLLTLYILNYNKEQHF